MENRSEERFRPSDPSAKPDNQDKGNPANLGGVGTGIGPINSLIDRILERAKERAKQDPELAEKMKKLFGDSFLNEE